MEDKILSQCNISVERAGKPVSQRCIATGRANRIGERIVRRLHDAGEIVLLLRAISACSLYNAFGVAASDRS